MYLCIVCTLSKKYNNLIDNVLEKYLAISQEISNMIDKASIIN